nr:recombinase family protein [uncultured Dysosmobacter sp.]
MSWVGGKKALREEVVKRFPLFYERYVEVFGGGGWVLFHKAPGNDFEVYNDYNGLLANLYRCVRDKPDLLINALKYVLNSREDFDRARLALRRKRTTDIQRAAWFYQVIRQSYAAALTSFASQPHDMWSNFPLIEQAHRRLADVVVENQDFQTLIRHYDRPVTFFYCDPPYRLVGRDLEIVPDEAKVVRWIYDAYLNGKGKDDIAGELNRLGIDRGHNREKWYPSTVNYILTNISYTGDMIWQKSFATDTIPFRQVRNRGQKPQYFVENCHPPIVSRDEFQRVQSLMAARKEQFIGGAKPRVSLYIDDERLLKQVREQTRQLARMPLQFRSPTGGAPSTDAARIERELNLCFNRADLNPDYMKTLIFAAAAERYSELPDASAQKKRKELSGWVNEDSLNNENLWTFFEDTVSAVRMGQKCMELVLAGDVIIQAREEESA